MLPGASSPSPELPLRCWTSASCGGAGCRQPGGRQDLAGQCQFADRRSRRRRHHLHQGDANCRCRRLCEHRRCRNRYSVAGRAAAVLHGRYRARAGIVLGHDRSGDRRRWTHARRWRGEPDRIRCRYGDLGDSSDVSPFSTNGAMVSANIDEGSRDRYFRQMLVYSGIVAAARPRRCWPGWRDSCLIIPSHNKSVRPGATSCVPGRSRRHR